MDTTRKQTTTYIQDIQQCSEGTRLMLNIISKIIVKYFTKCTPVQPQLDPEEKILKYLIFKLIKCLLHTQAHILYIHTYSQWLLCLYFLKQFRLITYIFHLLLLNLKLLILYVKNNKVKSEISLTPHLIPHDFNFGLLLEFNFIYKFYFHTKFKVHSGNLLHQLSALFSSLLDSLL